MDSLSIIEMASYHVSIFSYCKDINIKKFKLTFFGHFIGFSTSKTRFFWFMFMNFSTAA